MYMIMMERLKSLELKQLQNHEEIKDRNKNALAVKQTIQNNNTIEQKTSLKHALSEDIKDGGVERTFQVLSLGEEIPHKDQEASVFDMVISAERVDLLKLLLMGLIVDATVYHQANDDIRSSLNEMEIKSGFMKEKLVFPESGTIEKDIPKGLQSAEIYEIICYFQSSKRDEILGLLREWLMPLGIQVYRKEKQSNENSEICFFYAPVKEAILWYYQTSSDYYELTTKEIARQIELWDRRYGVTIAGAGKDWVDLWFHNLYISMEDFRWEASGFCPQLVLSRDWLRAGKISEDGKGLICFQWK